MGEISTLPSCWWLPHWLFCCLVPEVTYTGGDLGTAIKGFKKAMNDDNADAKKDADGSVQAEKLSHKE